MWLWTTVALAGGWPDITPPAPGGDGRHDAAVVVGIENYLLVDDVPGARTNAEDWFRWLTSTRGISPARVHLLRDVEGTKEKIERFATEAAAATGDGGTLWFVFVGHGAPSVDGQDGVLVGADAQSDPDSLYARSVSRASLLETLGKGAHEQTVVVLDTCFSGKSGRGALTQGLQPLIPSYALAPAPKTTILTAGAHDQFAGPLPEAGRPAFSYLVLGAMTGWGDEDGDGRVTAAEAVRYAGDAIAATVKGRKQTPELSGDDVVLAKGGSSEGPDIAQMVLDAGPARGPAVQDEALAQELAALRDEQRAQRAAEEREAARLKALEEATRAQLEADAEALKAKASAAWETLGDAPERSAVLDFVNAYGAASVSAGDETVQVDVAEVHEARAWLAGDARVSAQAPDPWEQPDTDMSWAPLWRPLGRAWRDGLDADPASIWLPYQMLQHWPRAIEYHTGPKELKDKRQALTGAYLLDAATYAEAWLATDDPERKRMLEHTLVGVILEARDVTWYITNVNWVDAPATFDEYGADGLYDSVREGGEIGHLAQWAVLEVLDRADDAPACAALVPKLEALAEEAAALPEAVDAGENVESQTKRVHKKGRALARKVHKCADDTGRVEAIEEQMHEIWW